MAKLTGQTIADSYDQLLIVDDANGISASLQAVESADTGGSSSALKIATNKIEIIPGSDDANAFEVSNAAGTAILTINSSTPSVLVSGSGVKLYFSDAGGEYISGDGTDLTITSGADIILAGTAVNITADTIDLSDATKDVTLNAAVDALNFDSNTLSIDASNNRVGIGTAAPAVPFHAVGSINGNLVRLQNNNASYYSTIEFYNSSTAQKGVIGIGNPSASSPYTDHMYLYTPASTDILFSAGASERMRITSAGNVGIGTNDPAGLLELKSKTSVACELYLNTTDTSTGSGVASILFGDTTDARGRIDYSNGADAMVFHTSESEAMRIDSSGNVQVEGQFTIQEVSGAGMVSAYKNVAVTGGSATTVFTITHTAGEVYWSAHFKGFAMLGNPAGAMAYECVAVYAQDPGGTEDAVAISETVETSYASWNAGAGNISGIVATLVNTSATVQELKFNVSLGGSDPSGPRVVGVLDLVYYDDGNDNAVVIT